MLKQLTYIEEWRCFKAGTKLEFRPGVNILVGDQGCGKSTLLETIYSGTKLREQKKIDYVTDGENMKLFRWDFEKDNPRTKSYFEESANKMMFQMNSHFHSHGETNQRIIRMLKTVAEGALMLMDEPDTALSIRSCKEVLYWLDYAVRTRKCQLLVSVHNPTIIQAFDEVLSLEHRRWMPSKEFIESQVFAAPKDTDEAKVPKPVKKIKRVKKVGR